MNVIRFIHFLGMSLWIGGGMAAMIMAVTSRGESVEIRAGVFRLLARVQSSAIGLGALLTLGSGILLTMRLMGTQGADAVMAAPRIWVMQSAGLIAGLLILLVSVPTAIKMRMLATPTQNGELLPEFERYRKRQAVVSSVAGVLALIALFAGAIL
ncbi:MAG: hypothetical protein ACE5HT_13920 [Gemmatimonadales bacterium]